MYCPGCGVQNVESAVRFCRGCGADLRLVSEAMSKPFSLVVANKVGKALEWEKNNWVNNLQLQFITNDKRRAWAEGASGVLALFGLIWILILGHGNPAIAFGFLFVSAGYLLMLSAYDIVKIRRRSRRVDAGV